VTWIDVVAPGESILSLYLDPSKLKRYSGTSFATPFVTGLAALVRSRDSNFTIHNFRQLLRESSTRIDDPLYDEKKLGYGLINLKRALDKLDDHPWDYSSTTQQGNTSSTVSSGGSISLPDNSIFFNPYGTQYSFSPYSSFVNYGVPTYGGFPGLFSNTYSPYIQQPYYYSGSFGFAGQMSQSNTYSPFVVSPFSQFTSGVQRFFPYSGYTILSPFAGGFSGSPFIIFSFPVFGYY
jgi:subtilisin family serine protease